MRLLNVNSLQIRDGWPDSEVDATKAQLWRHGGIQKRTPPFAILSHRWLDCEIPYERFQTWMLRPWHHWTYSNSLDKINGACKEAKDSGTEYVWIDTICIDKRDPLETTTAINCMFRWYQRANVCIVYLEDVVWESHEYASSTEAFKNTRWFKRGWTLQELLAPSVVVFFDRDWAEIGDRSTMASHISVATGISIDHVKGDYLSASVAQKMSWLSKRETTRIEDMAYCMLGLFGVYLDVRYGQGELEFSRLQGEILQNTTDETIFARMPPVHVLIASSGLLAPAPSCFSDSWDVVRCRRRDKSIPLPRFSRHGMDLSLKWDRSGYSDHEILLLHCERAKTKRPVQLFLARVAEGVFRRTIYGTLHQYFAPDDFIPIHSKHQKLLKIRVPHQIVYNTNVAQSSSVQVQSGIREEEISVSAQFAPGR